MNRILKIDRPDVIDRPEEVVPEIDTYDARALITNGVQASITLDGQVYFLRITRAGKLILTK